jgi:hypothetical protein
MLTKPPPTSLEAHSLAIFFLCASSRFHSILSNCSGMIFDLSAFDEADSSKLARQLPTSTFCRHSDYRHPHLRRTDSG